jgi:hypothetical protein
MDHVSQMLAMIDDFLAGGSSIEAFARRYQEFYIEVVPPSAPLTDDQCGISQAARYLRHGEDGGDDRIRTGE